MLQQACFAVERALAQLLSALSCSGAQSGCVAELENKRAEHHVRVSGWKLAFVYFRLAEFEALATSSRCCA